MSNIRFVHEKTGSKEPDGVGGRVVTGSPLANASLEAKVVGDLLSKMRRHGLSFDLSVEISEAEGYAVIPPLGSNGNRKPYVELGMGFLSSSPMPSAVKDLAFRLSNRGKSRMDMAEAKMEIRRPTETSMRQAKELLVAFSFLHETFHAGALLGKQTLNGYGLTMENAALAVREGVAESGAKDCRSLAAAEPLAEMFMETQADAHAVRMMGKLGFAPGKIAALAETVVRLRQQGMHELDALDGKLEKGDPVSCMEWSKAFGRLSHQTGTSSKDAIKVFGRGAALSPVDDGNVVKLHALAHVKDFLSSNAPLLSKHLPAALSRLPSMCPAGVAGNESVHEPSPGPGVKEKLSGFRTKTAEDRLLDIGGCKFPKPSVD